MSVSIPAIASIREELEKTVRCPCCGVYTQVPKKTGGRGQKWLIEQVKLILKWSESGINDKVIARAFGVTAPSIYACRLHYGDGVKFPGRQHERQEEARRRVMEFDTAVLGILIKGRPMRRKEVQDRLPKKTAKHTIINSLNRLHSKGALEKVGEGYPLYLATHSPTERVAGDAAGGEG